MIVDDDAPGLATEDQFAGKVGASTTLAESDLAPFKPRCDVLVTGHAHAPQGEPARQWTSRLRVNLPKLTPPSAVPALESADGELSFYDRVAWQQQREHALRPQRPPPGPSGETAWYTVLDKALPCMRPGASSAGAMCQ